MSSYSGIYKNSLICRKKTSILCHTSQDHQYICKLKCTAQNILQFLKHLDFVRMKKDGLDLSSLADFVIITDNSTPFKPLPP